MDVEEYMQQIEEERSSSETNDALREQIEKEANEQRLADIRQSIESKKIVIS